MRRLLLIVLVASGCEPSMHLGPRYGGSVRAAFERQSVRPPGQAACRPATTLDAQEAAVIWNGYVQSLAPRSREGGLPAGAILLGVPPPDGLLAPSPAAPAAP